MVYRIYDEKGTLVYEGHHWGYVRAYLDFLASLTDRPFRLVVKC